MAKPGKRPENWKPRNYKDALRAAVEDWGAVITPARNGHIRITFRNGGFVNASHSPSDRNAHGSLWRHMVRNGLKD